MYEFKDLSRLTTWALAVLATYAAFDLMSSLGLVAVGDDETALGYVGVLLIANFLFLIICLFVVGRWIYRASENAHALSSEMSITPGWAVGWYFVPFANLIKPLHAMREIWWASHESRGTYEESQPLLAWWWGLWITTNIASNIAWRVEGTTASAVMNLVAAILNICCCLALAKIMRDVTGSQQATYHANAFA